MCISNEADTDYPQHTEVMGASLLYFLEKLLLGWSVVRMFIFPGCSDENYGKTVDIKICSFPENFT